MTHKALKSDDAVCPCGSTVGYHRCCGRYLDCGEAPNSAELLMRSRYCGFVLSDEPYLLATWHPETRPSRVRFDDRQQWLGLSIRSTAAGGPEDGAGFVEFVARFKVDGKGYRLHENSRFEAIHGRWYYVDGQHL